MAEDIGLLERLETAVLGPPVCPRCGSKRGDEDIDCCEQEGQCDWLRDYGTHTDRFDDPWQVKKDILSLVEYTRFLMDASR